MNPRLQVKIRPMTEADLDRVMEIAASLPSAPEWPRKAWMDALDPDLIPPRIALVAEQLQSESLPPDTLNNAPMSGAILGYAVASLIPPQAEPKSSSSPPISSARVWASGSLLNWRSGYDRPG